MKLSMADSAAHLFIPLLKVSVYVQKEEPINI